MGPHIFQTCPSANYFDCKAMSIGARSQSARTYLERHMTAFSDCKCGTSSVSLRCSLYAHCGIIFPFTFLVNFCVFVKSFCQDSWRWDVFLKTFSLKQKKLLEHKIVLNCYCLYFAGNLDELVKHGLRALRETLPAEQDLTTKVSV